MDRAAAGLLGARKGRGAAVSSPPRVEKNRLRPTVAPVIRRSGGSVCSPMRCGAFAQRRGTLHGIPRVTTPNGPPDSRPEFISKGVGVPLELPSSPTLQALSESKRETSTTTSTRDEREEVKTTENISPPIQMSNALDKSTTAQPGTIEERNDEPREGHRLQFSQ